jgi:hypothetical protein
MISSTAKKTATSSKPEPSSSALKTLLVKFFQAKGDMLKLPAKMRVPLKFSVKETYPNFLITDGYYYTSIYFTKEAFQAHKN